MRIGVIGAGNMGSAFTKRLAASGHDVQVTATEREHAEKAAAAAGGKARAVDANQVANGADIVILAVPYDAAAGALKSAGDVAGKPVIDITNPLKADMSGLSVGHTTSAAEEIQKAVPDARVVKAFNTVFAKVLGTDGKGERRVQAFYAGDDEQAKRTVAELIGSMGFEGVDAGPLANARYLEPLGMLNIYLGYVAGRGTTNAPAIVPAG